MLNAADTENYFEKIVCGDMINRSKPDPDIYISACEMIGLPSRRCFALED
ncbi:MAG: HAD hydrolase-like protein, partial [Clostridiaceae bacterium]|nr:HAD hydrolase-like protein [Clostridiaceae bacterium]